LTSRSEFTLQVADVNNAPVAALPIGNQFAAQGALFTYRVPANAFGDADAKDALALLVTRTNGSAIPAWLAFDNASGTLSGTPLNADVGLLEIKVTATDGAGAIAVQTFDLSIANVNDSPSAAEVLDDQIAIENVPVSFGISPNAFADPDAAFGDALVLSAERADGAPLPAWLSFDQTSGRFGGTPGRSDQGVYTIKVTATDSGGLTVSNQFALAVELPNGLEVEGTGGATFSSAVTAMML
jgi:hypothetical protein